MLEPGGIKANKYSIETGKRQTHTGYLHIMYEMTELGSGCWKSRGGPHTQPEGIEESGMVRLRLPGEKDTLNG